LVEDDGHAAEAIRFAQLEHGEGGTEVGFAPRRDAVVAGDIRQVVFGNEERDHVEDGLKLRLRVNLPELALAGFLAAFAAVSVRGGDSGAGREAGLAEFLQTNPNFPRNPMGDLLQYFCERYNFAKTQTLRKHRTCLIFVVGVFHAEKTFQRVALRPGRRQAAA